MIIEGLIKLLFGVVNMLLSLIPKIELPDGFISLFDDSVYLLSFATYFLPVQTILTCLTVIFIVDNVKLFVSIFNWIISKIPTIS